MSDRDLSDRYARIRKALAMGPTSGPWRVLEVISVLGSDMGYRSVATTDDTIICGLRDRPSGDAHLIAACDPDTIRELLAERDQLAAALEAAREDAERYRWLRDPCSGAERVIFYCRGDYGRGLMSGAMLDAAIDDAMGKEASND